MNIDGTKLLIYAEGQPIEVTTKDNFDPLPAVTAFTEGQQSWTFTCNGLYNYDRESEELDRMLNQAINNLPRKLKKRFKRALFNGKFLNVSMGLKKHQKKV